MPLPVTKPGEAVGERSLEISAAEFDVDDASGTADVAPLVGPEDLPPGADSGLLLHDFLEVADLAVARSAPDIADWGRDPEVARQLADAARARGVDPRFLPHAQHVAWRMLTQPLALTDGNTLPPMVMAPALAREVEFAYPLDMIDANASAPQRTTGFVRGFIDALVAWDDELWVLDYKSDVLGSTDADPAALAAAARRRVDEHYGVQARLYAIAADRVRGPRRLAGLLFAFMRHDIVVPLRVDDDMLENWRHWLAQVARRPFAPTSAVPRLEVTP